MGTLMGKDRSMRLENCILYIVFCRVKKRLGHEMADGARHLATFVVVQWSLLCVELVEDFIFEIVYGRCQIRDPVCRQYQDRLNVLIWVDFDYVAQVLDEFSSA